MRTLAVVGLAALLGCGANATRPEAFRSPLFATTGPPRVFALVDGAGPFLFLVEPGLDGARVSAEWADTQGLPLRGDPARGARVVELGRLEVGDGVFTAVPAELVWSSAWGSIAGHRVVGVLGDALGAVEVTGAFVHLGPAPEAVDPLLRFGDPGCGARLAACVRARVEQVHDGSVRLAFERLEKRLPAGMWAQIDFGAAGHPLTTLVRLGVPSRDPRPGALALDIESPAISPSAVRPVGDLVDVLDLVPVGEGCPGQVCRLE